MIKSFRGRELVEGTVVQVYRNLHTDGFSIRDKKTGLVLAHGNNILVEEPRFVVGETGRKRVISEQVKNVHAYVEGKYKGIDPKRHLSSENKEVYYNPYTVEQFVVGEDNAKDLDIERVLFRDRKVYTI